MSLVHPEPPLTPLSMNVSKPTPASGRQNVTRDDVPGTWLEFKMHPIDGSIVLLRDLPSCDLPGKARDICVLDRENKIRYTIPTTYHASFEVGIDGIFVHDGKGRLTKYEYETGQRSWEIDCLGDMTLLHHPATSNGIYVLREDAEMYRIEYVGTNEGTASVTTLWMFAKTQYGKIQRAYVERNFLEQGAYMVCRRDSDGIDSSTGSTWVIKQDCDGKCAWETKIESEQALDIGSVFGRLWVLTKEGDAYVLDGSHGSILSKQNLCARPTCWDYRVWLDAPTLVGVSRIVDSNPHAVKTMFWSTQIGSENENAPSAFQTKLRLAETEPLSNCTCMRTDPTDGSIVAMSDSGLLGTAMVD